MHQQSADAVRLVNQAIRCGREGRHADAIAHARRALALQPEMTGAHLALSGGLAAIGRLTDAVVAAQQAVQSAPHVAEAHDHLGRILARVGRISDAVRCHRRAIELRGTFADAHANLGSALAEQGEQGAAVESLERAVALTPHSATTHSELLYRMLFNYRTTPEMLRDESARWFDCHVGATAVEMHKNAAIPERRLRVGYVSADFRVHPVARIIAPVLLHHDRTAFDVICYSSTIFPDVMTQRLRTIAGAWREIGALDDARAAALIQADEIDVLVDLAGHGGGNRLPLFARRPAPVQVQIGYPATTGPGAIDYRITDAHSDPRGTTEHQYFEQLVRMPRCAWCYTPDAEDVAIGPPPAIQNRFVTFGCLNQPIKVGEDCLRLWSRVLNAVPGSRLMLLVSEGPPDPSLARRLATAGIEADRVIQVERQPRSKYLECFTQIDIALDPFPFNGETTTCDSLWMGVPVITLTGKTCVSRRGVSHVTNVGYPELACENEAAYVRTAWELAADIPRLAKIRGDLRTRMLDSPMVNGRGYTRDLELAYREIWMGWCNRQI